MQAIAAITGEVRPQWVEVDEPRRQPDTVICRTLELGICGTDRDILASAEPWVPRGESHLVLGHECAAEVVEVGSEVRGLQPGDRVVPLVRRAHDPDVARPDFLPFGAYVERGICESHGFACSHWSDRPEHLLRVPAGLERWAVFAEPLSVAEKAIVEATVLQEARVGGWREPRVLITGQGPIAFACLIAARARGWEVVVLGRDDPGTRRSQLVVELGAAYQRWQDWPDLHGDWNQRAEEEGFDLILECTGSDSGMTFVAPWLRSLGICVWLGAERVTQVRPHALSSLMRDAILRNQIFLGTVNAARRDFEAAFQRLDWVRQQLRDPDRLFHQRLTPAEALDVFETRPPDVIKSIVEFA